MDIAPQYAGTLMGISNGISASAGFIAPYLAAALTKSVRLACRESQLHITFCEKIYITDVTQGLVG